MTTLLHHGTSLTGFCHIALVDMLGAYGGEDQASFSVDHSTAASFARAAVSMCADGQLAQYADHHADRGNGWDGTPFAAHRGENAAGGAGVVLSFDRASLHAAHAFKAVNFSSPGLETVDLGYSGKEKEECVFEDVPQLSTHLVSLSVDPGVFELYAAVVLSTLPNDEEARAAIEAGRAWVERFARPLAACA
jgi:hypothetical protein